MRLYGITDEYISFIRTRFPRVYSNKEDYRNYKNLIWSELEYIRKNENKIVKNARILYNKKRDRSQEKVVQNCLCFTEIEKMCDEWEKRKKVVVEGQ